MEIFHWLFLPTDHGLCVNDENLCKVRRDDINCEKCMCNDLKVMCNLLVTALIIALLLIVSGNVKLNPGPIIKCPKREKMMPARSNNCKCCRKGSALLVHSFF